MISTNENGLASAKSQPARNTILSRLPIDCTSPLDVILARLEHVKRYGQGWRTKCPAHDGKSIASLALTTTEDGRVLMHCFGGCAALDVVHAIGLGMSDLYPKRETKDMTPAERRQLWLQAKQSQWAAALDVLEREARIIQIAGKQIADGIPLDETDGERLNQAVQRIEAARLVLRG